MYVEVEQLVPLSDGRSAPLRLWGNPPFDQEYLSPSVSDLGGIDLHTDEHSGVNSVEFAYPSSGPPSPGPGFTWRVSRPDHGPLFRLVTAASDHRIVVHPDAAATLHYAGISPEPIPFDVSRFEITKKGVVADARVTDAPVTLNGINTAFRFTKGELQVRDGATADFTLEGTGPLPPALIGDATAQIAIRFANRAGAVRPVSSGATLTDDAPIADSAAGFTYRVQSVGLEFVPADGEYHFFFRLATAMEFAPPPGLGPDHVIADLAAASIQLFDAPLAGDASVLGDVLDFVVELPEPASFAVLGCFSMRILAVGFEPAYEPFDGAPAIVVSGQISFADGEGDKAVGVDSRHRFAIGAPAVGATVPRVHFEELAVVIEKGDAFKLDAVVTFTDSADAGGFEGEGILEIKGLPAFAIAVGFMRVRRPVDDAWLRAWFVAANVSKLTLRVPSLELYLRELGLGFGYRYTLTSIAAADQTEDVGELLAELRELSRSQGDLATRDAWSVSLEDPDTDARWTIALRALFSQGASPKSTPTRWDESTEAKIPSAFLFDVVAAVRSDLTILLAARGWLNTNYHDYLADDSESIRGNPLFSGFALLEPHKQRFLAQLASNPDGHLGSRPPLPAFAAGAIRNSQIAATIMVEPNLFHAEIGWPNQLRWGMNFGPLRAEARAGLIYRVHHARNRTDLVVGISYTARASVRFEAGVSVGVAGVDLIATADGAFGARLIGAAQLDRDSSEMQIYGAVGIDLRVRLELRVWIDFWLVTKRWTFALEMQFSASFALGIVAGANTALGVRGRGTLRIRVLGRSFEVRARIESNGGIVDRARLATEQYLSLGLEADDDADAPIPGSQPAAAAISAPNGESAPQEPTGTSRADDDPSQAAVANVPILATPDYRIYAVRPTDDGRAYIVIYPVGDGGFLPPPPEVTRTDTESEPESEAGSGAEPVPDFRIEFPTSDGAPAVEGWDPVAGAFRALGGPVREWTAAWDSPVYIDPEDATNQLTLAGYLSAAFLRTDEGGYRDPAPLVIGDVLSDERVANPTERAYEAAVRGAVDQFRASPLFKPDPTSTFEAALADALDPATTVYPGPIDSDTGMAESESPRQARGLLIDEMISNVRDYATDPEDPGFDVATSPVFLMGLVFRVDSAESWLAGDGGADMSDAPRRGVDGPIAPRLAVRAGDGLVDVGPATVFNRVRDDFSVRPPRLDDLRVFTDASTIAFAWDLTWTSAGSKMATTDGPESDPEHHLAHYEVTRRATDDSSDHMTTTVKPADVLHGGVPGGPFTVDALRPRFQYVDHFSHETADEVAHLPRAGKSYVYTITPVDVNGSRGRSVTTLATRLPNEPPPVPVDAVLTIRYDVDAASFARHPIDQGTPQPVAPTAIAMSWTPPQSAPDAPDVPISEHRLVFRKTPTVAVGSYVLDAIDAPDLPTSHARPRPDDVVVTVRPRRDSDHTRLEADLQLEDLKSLGVFPGGAWQPEGWRVFCQTVSETGVPSALVPIAIHLQFRRSDPQSAAPQVEERRPSHLEWITPPLDIPALDPHDASARAVVLHVPTPDATPSGSDLGAVNGIVLSPHPRPRHAVMLRWNQVPSGATDRYPADLYAGYRIFKADLDRLGASGTADPKRMRAAFVHHDDVRLVPGDELGLVPQTTRNVSEWEAWYPPRPLDRLDGGTTRRVEPSRHTHTLLWPTQFVAGDLDEEALRSYDATPAVLHPLLRRLLTDLGADHVINVEAGRPAGPEANAGANSTAAPSDGDLTCRSLLGLTDPKADPYGWAALQHLGLSMTLTLRRDGGSTRVAGADAFRVVRDLIAQYRSEEVGDAEHLYLEALIRPNVARSGSADALTDGALDSALLDIVQVSLRPLAVDSVGADAGDEVDTSRSADQRAAEIAGLIANSTRALGPNAGDLDAQADWSLYSRWSARFLSTASLHRRPTGFVATAYPTPSAPALATPDESGRVRHFDLIADGWSHLYRYVVQPFSRYDRLWHALAVSPVFKDLSGTLQHTIGEAPAIGAEPGIDVHIRRTAPVAPPVILHSQRLDAGRSSPGSTWEVALARHPEQALSELNLGLAKRLDFRHIAWTVLRRFVVDSEGLVAVDIDPRSVRPPRPRDPEPPGAIALDHAPDPAADPSATLAVTARTGRSEGAVLAIQIDHLPFFYEHQVVAVAQTSELVSNPVHTTQRDFGYISPPAWATMRTIRIDEASIRVIAVPLARLWDSLTDAQRQAWPDEAPQRSERRPGAVPDLDVSYDIVHLANGIATLVGRLFFDRPFEGDPRWAASTTLDGLRLRFLGGVNADEGTDPDMSIRDRHGEVELGPLPGGANTPPIIIPVPDPSWASALGARLIASDSADEPMPSLPTDQPNPWYVGLVGAPLGDDARTLQTIPALGAALDQLAALDGGAQAGGASAWTTFTPQRPIPDLPSLIGRITRTEEGRPVYSALEMAPVASTGQADDILDPLEDAAGPPALRAALGQLSEAMRAKTSLSVDIPPGVADLVPAHTIDFQHPTRMVWNGHPDLLTMDRVQLGRALADADLDVALPIERLLTRIDTTLSPAFVELWSTPNLDDMLSELSDDDEGRRILGALEGAPNAAVARALRMLGEGHPLLDELDRLFGAAAPDLRVSSETALTRPTQAEVADLSDGLLQIRPRTAGRPGSLQWEGYAAPELASELISMETDAGFGRALRQLAEFLERQHVPTVVELDPPIPVTVGLDDSATADRVIVSPHLLEVSRLVDHDAVLSLGSNTTPAGRAALRSIYNRSMTRDLTGGRLVIRTRRGSAPPSPAAEIEVAALEFDAQEAADV